MDSGIVHKRFIKEVMKSKPPNLNFEKMFKVWKVRCMQIRLFLKEVIKYKCHLVLFG